MLMTTVNKASRFYESEPDIQSIWHESVVEEPVRTTIQRDAEQRLFKGKSINLWVQLPLAIVATWGNLVNIIFQQLKQTVQTLDVVVLLDRTELGD